jgi:hypothetical protein
VFAEVLWLLLALLSLFTIGLGIVLLRSRSDAGSIITEARAEPPDLPASSGDGPAKARGVTPPAGDGQGAATSHGPPWPSADEQAGYELFRMSHEERARLLAAAGGWEPADTDGTPYPRTAPVAIGRGIGSTARLSGHIRGYVRDSGGSVITGASLTLIDVAGGQIGRKVTGGDGSYSLSTPGPGSYFLITRAKGHHPLASTVTISEQPVTLGIVLTGLAELSGVVRVTGSWTPVADVILTLLDSRGEVVTSTRSDAQGRYHFEDLVGGVYTLVASADPFQPVARLVTVADTGASDVDVELVAGTVLRGTTLGGTERRPVPDARVMLLDQEGNVLSVTRTDAAGEYLFLDVPEGSYTLSASGYPPVTASVRVSSGERHEHDLELRYPDD